MALDANQLGNELYSALSGFNEVEFENIETARQEYWQQVATVIIAHFKNNGVVLVPGTGLVAGSSPVTGQATGTIS